MKWREVSRRWARSRLRKQEPRRLDEAGSYPSDIISREENLAAVWAGLDEGRRYAVEAGDGPTIDSVCPACQSASTFLDHEYGYSDCNGCGNSFQ